MLSLALHWSHHILHRPVHRRSRAGCVVLVRPEAYSLDRQIHGGHVESLEHGLLHALSISLDGRMLHIKLERHGHLRDANCTRHSQILEEIVKIHAIDDIPVLQSEFIFCVNSSFLLWHGAWHVFSFNAFSNQHVQGREIAVSLTFYWIFGVFSFKQEKRKLGHVLTFSLFLFVAATRHVLSRAR